MKETTFSPRRESGFIQKSNLPFYKKHDVPKTLYHRHPYLPEHSERLHVDEVTQAYGETEPFQRTIDQLTRIEDDVKLSEILDHLIEQNLSDPHENAKLSSMITESHIQKLMSEKDISDKDAGKNLMKVKFATRLCGRLADMLPGRQLLSRCTGVLQQFSGILARSPEGLSLDDPAESQSKTQLYKVKDGVRHPLSSCTIYPQCTSLILAQREVAATVSALSMSSDGIRLIVKENVITEGLVVYLKRVLPILPLKDRLIFDTTFDIIDSLARITVYYPDHILGDGDLMATKLSEFISLYMGNYTNVFGKVPDKIDYCSKIPFELSNTGGVLSRISSPRSPKSGKDSSPRSPVPHNTLITAKLDPEDRNTISQLRMVLQTLRVLANIGAVRSDSTKVTLCTIDLANILGRHSMLLVREASVCLIASCSVELEVKKRVDPNVLAMILKNTESNSSKHIRTMALKAARSCCEYPEFRLRFVEKVLRNFELCDELFGILALKYIFELMDVIFYIPHINDPALQLTRGESSPSGSPKSGKSPGGKSPNAKSPKKKGGKSSDNNNSSTTSSVSSLNNNYSANSIKILNILKAFSTLLDKHLKTEPTSDDPDIICSATQLGIKIPPISAKIVAHEQCTCLKERLTHICENPKIYSDSQVRKLAGLILKTVYG